MRMTLPGPFSSEPELQSSTLIFTAPAGERFFVTVLEEGLIHVRLLPDGAPRLNRTWALAPGGEDCPLSGRQRDDLSGFSCPPFTHEPLADGIRLTTAEISLEIHTADGLELKWFDHCGNCIAADLPGKGYTVDQQSGAVSHYMQRFSGEYYYGLGERSGELNKAGRRFRMLNLDALGYNAETSDPLYKHIPFYITFRPELQTAYGIFYDNLSTSVFDFGCEHDNYYPHYRTYQAEMGDLDYYLIYGPKIETVVSRFTALTGRMPLMPRASLGYLGSTMSYTEAPDAQVQLGKFIENCQEHKIPCDYFHLSSGYSSGADGLRYVFTWNRQRIPDPAGMADAFHQAGIRLAANIKPVLLETHPKFDEVAGFGGFIQAAEADVPQPMRFWGGDGAHFDFTNPKTYAWWQAQVRSALLVYGIDATWNDNNECEVWDDLARCDGFGEPIALGLTRPLQTLLMVRASREAQSAFAPDKRPFVLTRSAAPGMQRYAQTWSGDNFTSWHSLRYNIPMGLGLGLSGMANFGHDLGGFAGPPPDAELLVRWIQNGVFQPRFCIHSWNDDESANEPWMHLQVLPIIRRWIEFRYRLIPYLYSLMVEASQTGLPLQRPLVLDFPQDAHCWTESFDFMLGKNLLVASITESGVSGRSVYLPGGRMWCNFYSGEWYEGGQAVWAGASLDQIPLFVPDGGLLPFGKVMRYVGEQADDLRQVYVFPAPQSGEGSFVLVEDDGSNLAYQRGEVSRVALHVRSTPQQVEVDAHLLESGYALPYRQIEWVLPLGELRPVQAAGPLAEWQDADGRRHLTTAIG